MKEVDCKRGLEKQREFWEIVFGDRDGGKDCSHLENREPYQKACWSGKLRVKFCRLTRCV